jgi:hypothetical protein
MIHRKLTARPVEEFITDLSASNILAIAPAEQKENKKKG